MKVSNSRWVDFQERSAQFLDRPVTRGGQIYALFSLILIFVTVLQVALAAKNPSVVQQYRVIFVSIENLILFFFSADLLLRLIVYRNKFKYLFSFYGFVDVIAVVPGLVGLFFPLADSTSWIRILRIFRVGRVLRTVSTGGIFGGFNGRLMPYVAGAIGFKALVLALEEHQWWPEVSDLGVMLGVVGFALAVLLGTKLRLVNSRIYSIEDAVCRIVGALRLMRNEESVKKEVDNWAFMLEKTIRNPTKEDVAEMRVVSDDLAGEFARSSVGGPNIAGFARDVAYVLHRVTGHVPLPYERFLRHVTFAYTAVVVLVVPGLTGFLTAILVVYVLIGMYHLIDDMDRPLEFSETSLITANLEPLEVFNAKRPA